MTKFSNAWFRPILNVLIFYIIAFSSTFVIFVGGSFVLKPFLDYPVLNTVEYILFQILIVVAYHLLHIKLCPATELGGDIKNILTYRKNIGITLTIIPLLYIGFMLKTFILYQFDFVSDDEMVGIGWMTMLLPMVFVLFYSGISYLRMDK